MRDSIVGRFFERHRQNHIAAALEWLHAFEQIGLAIEYTNAGRAAQLMPRKGIEIAVEILYIDSHVRYRLRTINQHRDATRMRERNHGFDRIDSTECVRHMHHTDEFRALIKQLLILVDKKFTCIVDWNDTNSCTFLFRQHLPGHYVRMVLKRGQIISSPAPMNFRP